jgi:asparagine N-glycosylation enzyme membrane subunit Stt3
MEKTTPSRLLCLSLVLLAMALVLWIHIVPRSLPDGPTRAALTYTGTDGREHVYLGDYDSYLWLRHARNLLRTGTTCDAVVDGVCRDTLTLAPVGAPAIYAGSLHAAAIACVHRIVTRFSADYPLPASASWIPAIVAVLGVLPAFFIARSLAGAIAGPFAAVVTLVHPFVLSRTLGSDNDVWNVVLPLYTMWALLGAVGADSLPRRGLCAGLAGACVGLQAWTWRGWPFAYTVAMAGLLGCLLLHAARHVAERRALTIWRATEVRQTAVVLVIFYAAAGVSTSLADPEAGYLALPAEVVRVAMRAVQWGPDRAAQAADWPNTLNVVSELRPLGLWGIMREAGGAPVLLGGLLGLILLLSPRRPWRWPHWSVLFIGMTLYAAALAWAEPGRFVTIALLGAPLAAAWLASWRDDEDAQAPRRQARALLLVVWFLAAIYQAHGGYRFLLLLAAPLGIACAVVAGRLLASVRRVGLESSRWYRAAVSVALAAVLTLVMLHAVRRGYASARDYVPAMNDAWWDTLGHIRDTAGPAAVVHTWWDYGHWVTYLTERAVSNDGTSLLTHVPHWVARALIAPGEGESVGILRMLGCGSDATPRPAGTRGAYGKLVAAGRDPVAAYSALVSVMTLDAAAAATDLERRGLGPEARADVLRSTHCDPPEAYLVLSSTLLHKRQAWMALGLWDPSRPADATPGRTPSPIHIAFSPLWLPCRPAGEAGELVCAIEAPLATGSGVLDRFVYDPAAPERSRLYTRRPDGPRSGETTAGPPAVVMMAAAREMREVAFPSPTESDLGVLIDAPNRRIRLGAPPLLRSTYVQLMYLDGRYARHYEKVDDRYAAGERVTTWKIRWNRTDTVRGRS